MKNKIKKIIKNYYNDKTRLMDILIDTQVELGYLSDKAVDIISRKLDLAKVDVLQTISFYHFFHQVPKGKYTVYLNNSAVAVMKGRNEIARIFEEEVGCTFGQVSADGLIGLFDTACIGMNDQEPAAIINNTIFTQLTSEKVKNLVAGMKAGKEVRDLVCVAGDGHNRSELIRSMVSNNIKKSGPVIFSDFTSGSAIRKIVNLSQDAVINLVKLSNVRGRGGAGFPTGVKWEFCKKAKDPVRYVFCNADEGEPGTFKDRVILTEYPKLVFEGMVLAGYAVGSKQGILYLRYEYKYLQKYLEQVLADMRRNNLLGENICNKKGFNFDIRIQFGAGAYVCGEESALIESAEGKRGEPRDRPPFPVEKGYLNRPTIVNNVETLCTVVKIILNGGDWLKQYGTKESTGTKVLSISGDCKFPGVYEIEWGFHVNDILKIAGAENPQAVQVGGPSGSCIGPAEFNRILGYEDLSTGGSIIIIGKQHDLLNDVVLNFMDFFIEESCGSCAPCRALTVMFRNKLQDIINGYGSRQDLENMVKWGEVMQLNRCGLGTTAANPILTTLKNFPHLYEAKIKKDLDLNYNPKFNLKKAVEESCLAAGRTSQI